MKFAEPATTIAGRLPELDEERKNSEKAVCAEDEPVAEKEHEELVVAEVHTRVDPRAVMVELP